MVSSRRLGPWRWRWLAWIPVAAACANGVTSRDSGDHDDPSGVGGGGGGGGDASGGDGAGGVAPTCGNGVLDGTEECDDGELLPDDGCDAACLEEAGYDCTGEPSVCSPVCGDGVIVGGEECDDGDTDSADGCSATCVVEAGYDCQGEPSLCCPVPLISCDGVCIDVRFDAAHCGSCPNACPGTQVCANGTCSGCSNGATLLSIAPSGGEVVCDDPTDVTCEQDLEVLCPAGWGLCTHLQHGNRHAGWTFSVAGQPAVLGEIYCRSGGGAGHYTVGIYFGEQTLADPTTYNCNYGSSRPPCPSSYGCNEQTSRALCCKPTPTCGNGVTDPPEEECDDMNAEETDACLSSCVFRQGAGCL